MLGIYDNLGISLSVYCKYIHVMKMIQMYCINMCKFRRHQDVEKHLVGIFQIALRNFLKNAIVLFSNWLDLPTQQIS